MIWWEKTVEYLYITKYIQSNAAIAPLAGHHEKAGDALVKLYTGFILIEFKKDEKSISSEQDKFEGTDYGSVKKALKGKDAFHYIIYGAEDKNKLVLKARPYFSATESCLDKIGENTVELKVFKEYLNVFISYKKTSSGGGGGGGMTFNDYSLVAGVNPEGDIVAICSDLDFHDLSLEAESNQETELISASAPEPE